MSWTKGNQITASKLNAENKIITKTISVGLNSTGEKYFTHYIHKPASGSTVVANSTFHSLDGWWGHAADHYIKMWSSNSGGGTGTLLVNKSWTSYQNRLTYNIVGSQIPRSGWYKFYIKQKDDWGGETITMRIYTYPMAAKVGNQIVEFSSTGNRIAGNQLTASKLNGHYITTL